MDHIQGRCSSKAWSLLETYKFMYIFLNQPEILRKNFRNIQSASPSKKSSYKHGKYMSESLSCRSPNRSNMEPPKAAPHCLIPSAKLRNTYQCHQRRYFHDYFVTHLPSSSLHPDSRSSSGPHHKLPRAASIPHTVGSGRSPAAAPPMTGPSRELTVVRIPLRSAKHHFGVSVSRGTRPYNEDAYQAGTIEIPAFAKRAPLSLNRSSGALAKEATRAATPADGASGDPQVFYFGIFDGHGGHECSDFLKDELHEYIESASEQFGLASSLKESPQIKSLHVKPLQDDRKGISTDTVSLRDMEDTSSTLMKAVGELKSPILQGNEERYLKTPAAASTQGKDVIEPEASKTRAVELEVSLVKQWKETVGGYFRRFKPEYFSIPFTHNGSGQTKLQAEGRADAPISIETVLMYAFLRADLDFVTAQASKPDPESTSDMPLNNDEILGEPSRRFHKGAIGGPTRFKGGSTASIAMISTPTPTPFWHPASPSTLLVAHVGDTRILLCETSTGLAVPVTTNHHPSSPVESSRLRRYAATFVTDSFGEERMSGLANTRAFGDMRSKRIGVSAEPELRRYELGPAQYSFLVLISDGVSGTLSDQEIVDVVKEAKTPEQGAKDVVGFATEVSTEGDNATCLIIRLGGWERRGEGGMGSLGTKEARDFRRQDATDPRTRRT